MRTARVGTDGTRIVVQIVLLACCLLVTAAVRAVIDVDDVSDSIELTLNATALVVLIASIVLSLRLVRAMRVRALRTAGTVLSLLLIGLAGAFAHRGYADLSIELADLIQPAQAAEENAQIVVGPTGDDVRLSGDIKEGAADLLERILDAHPAIRRIHLTSDGGFADEGQALGKVIAAHGLTAYVPDYCVSACTLAFVGGRQRLLMEGARLGFHAPYQEGLLGQTFVRDATAQRAAYIAAGLSADFVDAALKVAPDDLWLPERDRLLAAHAITGTVDRYRFPNSYLDGAADREGARDAVLRNFPMLKSIDANSPQVVERIAAWYLHAYRRGTSEGEATEGLKRIVDATMVLVFARADDATLLDLARFVQSARNAAPPSREHETIGTDMSLVRATAVLEDGDKDADARAERLVDRALASERSRWPQSGMAPVAFALPAGSCAASRQPYVNALRRRDPAQLRRCLEDEAPAAARVLAPLAVEGW